MRSRSPALRLLVALLLCGHAAVASADWDALNQLQREGAVVTALAVDLDDSTVIQQLNSASRLSPASLSKLVAAAAALDTWPADEVFTTRLAAAAEPAAGVLAGNLLLLGGGDSTLDHQQLWTLAAQLRSRGITRVDGGLQVVPGSFPTLPCGTKDRCDAVVKTATSYDAQVSSLGVDYGAWCIDVSGTAPGQPASVLSCAGVTMPIAIEGRIDTLARTARPTFWMDRRSDATGDRLVVGGGIPQGASQRFYRSMADPLLGTGQLMHRVIESLGIDIQGPAFVSPVATPGPVLGSVDSVQLREQVGRLLRYSNNYITDVLTVGAVISKGGQPQTLAEAAQRMADLQFESTAETGPLMTSGSGLTPENRLSARDLVSLLQKEYLNSLSFPVFYAGLVVPRHGHSRMLKRDASQDWLDRVAVKTGTLTEPVTVHGLSGYMRKRDGGWIAFAVIVNGIQGRNQVPYWKATQAVRKDLDALLKRY